MGAKGRLLAAVRSFASYCMRTYRVIARTAVTGGSGAVRTRYSFTAYQYNAIRV